MSYISIFLSCQSWVLDILKAKLKNSKKQKLKKPTQLTSPQKKDDKLKNLKKR